MTSNTVYLVGVGGFGIHHLEGLITAKTPLTITVIDASLEALERARAVCRSGGSRHTVRFAAEIPKAEQIDVAIVATTSGSRANAIRSLLACVGRVRFVILEKILFDAKPDYASIGALLKKRRVEAWVNCPRRIFPLHEAIKKKMRGPLWFHLSAGARFGLMTNVIHYIDYLCYLAKSNNFRTDTSMLVPRLLTSKRSGYHEMCGTLVFKFKDGSRGAVTTLQQPESARITIAGKNLHAVIEESRSFALLSEKTSGWKWKEEEAPILNQSAMSGSLVEQLLKTGRCGLTPYEESAAIHLAVFEPVRRFLERSLRKPFKKYQFT